MIQVIARALKSLNTCFFVKRKCWSLFFPSLTVDIFILHFQVFFDLLPC